MKLLDALVYKESKNYLSNKILTWANLVSTIRILLIPVFVRCILTGRFGWALCIFAIAGISDGLDGYLARRLNQRTLLGQILDPIGDKLLMLTSFLVLASQNRNYIPISIWLAVCVIIRDLGIVCAAILIYWYTGFCDFRPSIIGKLSTTIQVCFIVLVLLAQLWSPALVLIPAATILTIGMTLFSGMYYTYFVNLELKIYRLKQRKAQKHAAHK